MSERLVSKPKDDLLGWYEEISPIRGYNLCIQNIIDIYQDLSSINRVFGEQLIAKLPRDEDMTDEEWCDFKRELLDGAFRVTVTINGLRDQKLYGESVAVFSNPNIPNPIKSIYFTNITAFSRNANGDSPLSSFGVLIDFSKPDIFDPSPLVSAATPNLSELKVISNDITFFNAVQRAVEKRLKSVRSWYGVIHRNFAYDFGIIFALPLALYFSAFHMDKLIPEGSNFELYRWPLFMYLMWASLVFYRGLISYVKWAFPVNVLLENKDRSFKHRLALAAFASWFFYSVAGSIYEKIAG